MDVGVSDCRNTLKKQKLNMVMCGRDLMAYWPAERNFPKAA